MLKEVLSKLLSSHVVCQVAHKSLERRSGGQAGDIWFDNWLCRCTIAARTSCGSGGKGGHCTEAKVSGLQCFSNLYGFCSKGQGATELGASWGKTHRHRFQDHHLPSWSLRASEMPSRVVSSPFFLQADPWQRYLRASKIPSPRFMHSADCRLKTIHNRLHIHR